MKAEYNRLDLLAWTPDRIAYRYFRIHPPQDLQL